MARGLEADISKIVATLGKAKYLVTRDSDLLDIPKASLRGIRFQIVTPFELLRLLDEL